VEAVKQPAELCHRNSLLATCKDPCKELLLDRIKLSNVAFVSATTGFAVHHLQSRQHGHPLDKEEVGYYECPRCSAERKIVRHPNLQALFHELNLVEVGVAFANNAGGAAFRTDKDRLRHSGNGGGCWVWR